MRGCSLRLDKLGLTLGTFRKLLIPANGKSSQDFRFAFRCCKRLSVRKPGASDQTSHSAITTSKSSKKGEKKGSKIASHAISLSLIYIFLFSQGSLMFPISTYWGRGCTKYKLPQVKTKIALGFSPLSFKAYPILPPAPIALAVSLQWSRSKQPGWSSHGQHSPSLSSTTYPLMG